MEDPKVYPVALTANGWALREKCTCSGIRKLKFAHRDRPGVIIEWWVKYFKFKVTDHNRTIQGQTPISKLTQWIQDYNAKMRVTAAIQAMPKNSQEKEQEAPADPTKDQDPEAEEAPIETETKKKSTRSAKKTTTADRVKQSDAAESSESE